MQLARRLWATVQSSGCRGCSGCGRRAAVSNGAEDAAPDVVGLGRPAPAEAVRGHDDGCYLADDVDAGSETMRTGVGERTRCRTAQGQKASDNTAYLLRHIPVPGVQSAVDIPDTVQLLHTGFVIGRVGADHSLTSGYVSRKHAQLQRTVCGPCGPISVVHACRVMIVFPARCRWLGNATEALSVSMNGARTR